MNLDEGHARTIRAFRDWYGILMSDGAIDPYGDFESAIFAFGQCLTGGLMWLATLRIGIERGLQRQRWFLALSLMAAGSRDKELDMARETRPGYRGAVLR